MRSSRSSVIALSAAALLLIAGAIPALAASPAPAALARAEHNRIVSYWTAERLASAKPRDFVRTARGFEPAAKPGGGGGGGTTVTGASWTGTGTVNRSVGKVFFTLGGGNWQCSGAVATDGGRSDRSLVLTAGHCAVDETTGAFATNWMFIPAWDEKPATYSGACTNSLLGCWTATTIVAHRNFATAGGFNSQATRHDFAFAVVPAGGHDGAQLDAKVTPFGLANFGSITKGTQMYAFGFPAAGKYKGNDLTYCAGKIIEDVYNDNATWGMGCNMTGGSSGGPWFASFSAGSGLLGSLNSYGYSGVRNMYGPKFNNATQSVYNAALSATSNTLVP
jgi:hypothetical protein